MGDGLGIYFSEDIRNALLAANEASAATADVIVSVSAEQEQLKLAPDELRMITMRAYREGYKAALRTVALSFGLSPEILDG